MTYEESVSAFQRATTRDEQCAAARLCAALAHERGRKVCSDYWHRTAYQWHNQANEWEEKAAALDSRPLYEQHGFTSEQEMNEWYAFWQEQA